jgi:hypothetical protein
MPLDFVLQFIAFERPLAKKINFIFTPHPPYIQKVRLLKDLWPTDKSRSRSRTFAVPVPRDPSDPSRLGSALERPQSQISAQL